MKKSRRIWIGAVLLSLVAVPALSGTILGTKHDFTGLNARAGVVAMGGVAFSDYGSPCVYCHIPPEQKLGDSTTQGGIQGWNRFVPATNAYQVYDSRTLDNKVKTPSAISLLCLSCHDGTVAVDSFGGATGTNFMTGPEAVGRADQGSLANDHPIGFVYDAALVTLDGSLHPTTNPVTIGTGGSRTRTGTIANQLLFNGRLECASCHDVHNTFTASNGTGGGAPLLRITKAGSTICLTCHNK